MPSPDEERSPDPSSQSLDRLIEAAEASRRKTAAARQAREFRIIRFRSGGRDFAVPIDNVQRTERVPMITAVPRSPPYVRGVASLKGEVVCIFDLRRFLSGEEGVGPADATSLLVIGEGLRRIAVLSESLPDFERISVDEIMAVPSSEVEIYSGAVERDSSLVGLIDPAKLCDLIERRLGHGR
jgi:purine-binding chemotaxis protein CheW